MTIALVLSERLRFATNANNHKELRYDTVIETGVFIGFYLPCERTLLGPIITKPIPKDKIPLDRRSYRSTSST
jgi:hypothetical protein